MINSGLSVCASLKAATYDWRPYPGKIESGAGFLQERDADRETDQMAKRRLLVVFSNPPDQSRLRLDEEDKVITRLARKFEKTVQVDRLHASEIEDIHELIVDGNYDIVQFSGHGHRQGLCLEKSHCQRPVTDFVSADRVVDIVNLARNPVLVVVFLSCYSDSSIDVLSGAAPFVVTSREQVTDDQCITFVRGFYESFFTEPSVKNSFDHAVGLLGVRDLPKETFRLSRRCLTRRGDSLYVESTPDLHKDSILVNLDRVKDRLDKFGISEEELCHLLAKKIRVHHWIFERAREHATIPIGRLLFGEFEWRDARDVVHCTKLMKLSADVPREHWEVWAKVLVAYNDLVSCEYRTANTPAEVDSRPSLERAVRLFNYHTRNCFTTLKGTIEQLGASDVIPHIEFAVAETEKAAMELEWERYPHVVEALELALTNLHEVVTGLQPPEEEL